MIEIRDLWKSYHVKGQAKIVARGLNLLVPSRGSVGLFGRNGAGQSIVSDGTVSGPVGFAGSFHGELTGAQNVRFVGRVYGVDTDDLVEYVQDFAGLGPHFHAPFRTYSSGMRSRLAFGLSMGIKFDTYLVDEVTSVGDAAFRERSTGLLQERINESAAIIVSHSMPLMKKLCDKGIVMIDGQAKFFDDIDEAIETHETAMKGIKPDWVEV